MLKFKPYKRKTSVTCLRTENDENKGKKFITITDEANGKVLFENHGRPDDTKISQWFRIPKEDLLGMIGSLWPDEVAIVTDDNYEDDDD